MHVVPGPATPMLLSCVEKHSKARQLVCLLFRHMENNTKAKERNQHLKVQQTATAWGLLLVSSGRYWSHSSSLCLQVQNYGRVWSPRCPRPTWHKSCLCHGWECLLSALYFLFSTIFYFSIYSFCFVSLLLVSPSPKTALPPWSKGFCQALQTFSYGYLCLFCLRSFSRLSSSLRYSHSPFSHKQDLRLWTQSAWIDLWGDFSLRLASTFSEVSTSLWIPPSFSPTMGSVCKHLCSLQDSQPDESMQNWKLIKAARGNQIVVLLSFQKSEGISKKVSGLVELQQVLLWDGMDSRTRSGPALFHAFLPSGLYPSCTPTHTHTCVDWGMPL